MIRFVVFILFFFVFARNSIALEVPETERFYLSGKDRTDGVLWDFRCSAGARAGRWAQIPVPSNWEMQGFGTLSYGSTVPSEKGEYIHHFIAPAAWQDRRISLVFEGVMTDTAAKLNGQSVGPVHQGGFYRFRYDITPLIKWGANNVLEVLVDETSTNQGVNRAERTGDYWNFGGIYRPVWLEAAPVQSIERVAINAGADGHFTVDAFLSDAVKKGNLLARIFQLDGTEAGPAFAGSVTKTKTQLQTRLPSVKRWTAETPNLYRLELSLLDGDKVLHRIQQTFGFRSFAVRPGDGLYLNGRRIILQGANRHSLNADSGRCLGEADWVGDIRLMKDMNMNAVRCSHYPPDERFLDLCDELGLYVLDELAGWQKSYDTPVGRSLLGEMLRRDANHPSILFWDNGNEGGENVELDKDFAQWDPQGRPVLHPWGVLNGINTAHYRTFSQAAQLVQGKIISKSGESEAVYPPNIYMPTEFQHGLYDGGAGAGLDDYWTLMRSSPFLGGGFLWALLDEGVRRPETGVIDVCGNAGPDGVLGPRREKEASYYTIKELWSPVVVAERALPDNFDGKLSLENRYSFTDLRECRFSWELRRMPTPSARSTVKEEVLASAKVEAPSVGPGQKGKIKLGLPRDWQEADVLALRVEDPHGGELWTWTWALPGLAKIAAIPATDLASSPCELKETADHLVVHSNDLVVSFAKADGRIAEVNRAGHKFTFLNGPRSVVAESKLVSLKTRSQENDVMIEAHYQGSLRTVAWRVRANGWIDCRYEYVGLEGSPYEGIAFDYPSSKVKAKSWVGGGPYRVWQNRLRGVPLGAWRNTYNDTVTGWSGWEYPEFKGIFADVRWLRLETGEGQITVIPGSGGAYVQVLTPDLAPAALRMKAIAAFPEAGLALLDVIPAMGDKFHRAEQNGPSGSVPPLKSSYTGKVSFRFDLDPTASE